MSKTLVETPIKAAPVIVPEGGVDLRKAITVEVPFQALADRAKYLEDHVDILDAAFPGSSTDNGVPRFDGATGKKLKGSTHVIEDTTGDVSGVGKITYLTPKIHTILIGPAAIQPSASTVVYGRASSAMICSTDSVTLLVDLSPYLTDRCTITGWTIRVHPGAARSGGARMYTRLLRESLAGAVTQIGSTTYDDTTGAAQSIVGTGSVSEQVDRGAYSYSIEIGCGNNASSYPDTIIWALITISESGPGLGA